MSDPKMEYQTNGTEQRAARSIAVTIDLLRIDLERTEKERDNALSLLGETENELDGCRQITRNKIIQLEADLAKTRQAAELTLATLHACNQKYSEAVDMLELEVTRRKHAERRETKALERLQLAQNVCVALDGEVGEEEIAKAMKKWIDEGGYY
jgi:hypothetical protein